MSKIAEENLVEVFEKGTENNPYLISDRESLASIQNNLSAHYQLTKDIDLGETAFGPMGTFTGVLDGAGYAIRNLKQNVDVDYGGLFSQTNGATIKNLKLEGAAVSGSNYIGILAGTMTSSTAENIFVEGTVHGGTSGNYVGGLAGNVNKGNIRGCKAIVTVSGEDNVGGLLGGATNQTVVENSCALGNVTATNRGISYIAGLVGYASSATIRTSYAACSTGGKGKGLVYVSRDTTVENSYYDSQVAGKGLNDSYNIGKLTSALMRQAFFADWDFEKVWTIREGESYPYLQTDVPEGFQASAGEVEGGMGTEESPYLIGNRAGIESIGYEWSAHYQLTKDIDLGETAFGPMGTFTGVLDGAGYAIRNLKQNVDVDYGGLFSQTNGATIKNLKLEGAAVSGSNYIGILAGTMTSSTAENIFVEGTVHGGTSGNYVGGLAGNVNKGNIRGCKAIVTVSGEDNVGGLLGGATNQTVVENSCALGNVTATNRGISYIAGLVGYASSATIRTSYAACSTGGKGKGLVYVSRDTTVENSYFDSTVSGLSSPIEQARTTEQLMQQDTYVEWDWENIWKFKEESLPELRVIEQEYFNIIASNITSIALVLECPRFENVEYYLVTYGEKKLKANEAPIYVEGLLPETEYSFRMQVQLKSGFILWSDAVKVKTRALVAVCGLHSIEKGTDYIQLEWDPVTGVERYEVFCNGKRYETSENTIRLSNLQPEIPYEISIKVIFTDGGNAIGKPIIEKIYTIDPKSEYAIALIERCEEEKWFIDALENLLNQQGKSINWISSQKDLETIYAIDLRNRGIRGRIPRAIGELKQLRYLYLANNHLGTEFPDEISQLNELISFDLI